MDDCIFCKIAKKELVSEIVYEDSDFSAFKDIKPLAPVHILIVPKKHISSIKEITPIDKEMIGGLFLAAKKVADILGVSESGYRLIFNVGRNAGQTVEHLHLHLMSGKKLLWS